MKKLHVVIFETFEGPAKVYKGNPMLQLYTWTLIKMMVNHHARMSDFADEHVRAAPLSPCTFLLRARHRTLPRRTALHLVE